MYFARVKIYLGLVIIVMFVTRVSSLPIRLTGGTKPTQGRLEIFQGNSWGIFCGSTWTPENTQVVCRQLGFPGAVTFSFSSTAVTGANGRGVHPVDISCNGSESILSSCSTTSSTCRHALDVDIICQDFGYAGCYLQSNFSSLPTLTDGSLTNDICIESCRPILEVHYAVLQNSDCFCEESLSGFTRKDYDWNCGNLCVGNQAQSCGGPQVYSVFSTDVGFCVEPPKPYLGDHTLASSRYGSLVEFHCDSGFELLGNSKLQCLGSSADALEWSGEYPVCAEKRFVILGLVLSVMGASIVFLSMVCAVYCEIRRKLHKGHGQVDTGLLSASMSLAQDTPSIQWNPQTNIAQHGPPPVTPVRVSPSPAPPPRLLQNTANFQAAGPPPIPVSVPSTTAASEEYSGVYEELDDYVSPGEDFGGGMELVFERFPSEEESYEMSPTAPQSAAAAVSGQDEIGNEGYLEVRSNQGAEVQDGYLEVLPDEENPSDPSKDRPNTYFEIIGNGEAKEGQEGYLEVRSDQGEEGQDGYLKVRSNQGAEVQDGYLEVLPDEENPSDPNKDRPNTYFEIIGNGDASTNREQSGHDYTYIADVSKVDTRPRLSLPLEQIEEEQRPEYDDIVIQPIYRNEGAMCPRPRRQDLEM